MVVPDTESGKSFAGQVRGAVPAALMIPVPGQATDLMFCREHGCMKPGELMAMLGLCMPAYYQSLTRPQTSPHARFDVGEWMPLSE